MAKLGLKLWSINKQYVQDAVLLFEKGYYDFIELYAVPGSFEEFGSMWKKLRIPYVIHAPHIGLGVINFAQRELFEENLRVFEEVQKYADLLNAKTIVFHPGVAGTLEEIISQVKHIKDSRIIVENMPNFAIGSDQSCLGDTPTAIADIKDELGLEFCLDIGHAIYAANALQKNPIKFIQEFIALEPVLIHLADGQWDGLYDVHKNLGKGSFPLSEIINHVPKNIPIMLETEKTFKDSLDDYCEDVRFFRRLIQIPNESVLYASTL